MAQLTYKATWSKEGLSSELKVPKKRSISPRARSRSVHSPSRAPRMRFASGQQSPSRYIFPVDEWSSEWSSEYEYQPEPEDSVYIASPSINRRRRRSPERGVPLRSHSLKSSEMTWLRLGIYSVILMSTLGLLIKMLLTLKADLQIKYAHAREETMAEIAACRSSYNSNYCRDNPPPALAQVCQEWARCMEYDPDNAGQLTVTAGALGEIVEAFVYQLDLRSMVVLACVGGALTYWS